MVKIPLNIKPKTPRMKKTPVIAILEFRGTTSFSQSRTISTVKKVKEKIIEIPRYGGKIL